MTPVEKTRYCKSLHKTLFGPAQRRIDKARARLEKDGDDTGAAAELLAAGEAYIAVSNAYLNAMKKR